MVDLNTLVIFAKVVEANSFSEAARRLKMPISTVSRRIADLEDGLGVRLLERSTRSLRLTDVGSDVLEQAQRGAELSDIVDDTLSNRLSRVSGMLRLSSPPSISDSLLAPLIGAFQAAYPDVKVQVLVTDRIVDHLAEGTDLAFRVGSLEDPSLLVRRLLTYRHQLVASPAYLEAAGHPRTPRELLCHRLLAFSFGTPLDYGWSFEHVAGGWRETLPFLPHLAINDYAGLATALLAGAGIGEMPPVVRPRLLAEARLIEVMRDWRFPPLDLSLVRPGGRSAPRCVQLFEDFAARMTPAILQLVPE